MNTPLQKYPPKLRAAVRKHQALQRQQDKLLKQANDNRAKLYAIFCTWSDKVDKQDAKIASIKTKQQQASNVSILDIMATANEAGIPPGGVILALNNLAPNEPQISP